MYNKYILQNSNTNSILDRMLPKPYHLGIWKSRALRREIKNIDFCQSK